MQEAPGFKQSAEEVQTKSDELFKEMMCLIYLLHKSLRIQAIYLTFSQQAGWLQGGERKVCFRLH